MVLLTAILPAAAQNDGQQKKPYFYVDIQMNNDSRIPTAPEGTPVEDQWKQFDNTDEANQTLYVTLADDEINEPSVNAKWMKENDSKVTFSYYFDRIYKLVSTSNSRVITQTIDGDEYQIDTNSGSMLNVKNGNVTTTTGTITYTVKKDDGTTETISVEAKANTSFKVEIDFFLREGIQEKDLTERGITGDLLTTVMGYTKDHPLSGSYTVAIRDPKPYMLKVEFPDVENNHFDFIKGVTTQFPKYRVLSLNGEDITPYFDGIKLTEDKDNAAGVRFDPKGSVPCLTDTIGYQKGLVITADNVVTDADFFISVYNTHNNVTTPDLP